MAPVKKITLEKWENIHEYKEDGWVYRGEPNTNDKLKTTLEKKIYRDHDDLCKQVEKEKKLLREFKRRYHQYADHIPEDKDYLEWFSIMRHYSAPTRFLDFSFSIYVAAYFALEYAKKDEEGGYAIWAIDGKWTIDQAHILLKLPDELKCGIQNKDKYKKIYADKIFEENNLPPCLRKINPFKLTERLTLQQGVFVCPSNINKSFMENLENMEGHDKIDHVVKIIIPKNLRDKAMKNLRRMNINRATLFPGLDGFAKFLDVSGPVFEG